MIWHGKQFISLLIIWLVVGASAPSGAEEPSRYCPYFCECSLKNEKNHADCRARRLISASIELPFMVEVLDLSYNNINYLDQNCFKVYVYLYSLVLAQNEINAIHLDAFSALDSLHSLDLSYNRLEYLDERLFETNRELKILNLEGNKFLTLPNRPFLRSTSIIQLYLQNAHINSLNMDMFKSLPALRGIDLSKNLLNHFKAAVFNNQMNLQTINFEDNSLICDARLQRELAVLQKREVDVYVDDCKAWSEDSPTMGRSEKDMEHMKELDLEESQSPTERSKIDNIWHIPDAKSQMTVTRSWLVNQNKVSVDDEKIEMQAKVALSSIVPCSVKPLDLCHKYQQCLNALSNLLATKVQMKDAEIAPKNYSINDLQLAFALGAASSVSLLILAITSFICCRAICCKKKYSAPAADGIEIATDEFLSIGSARPQTQRPLVTIPPPVPPRSRQQRRPRRQAPNPYDRSLVRPDIYQDRSSTDSNFIARLFGRPARHQYYRAINQNAATLIRSLSRSNLFNSRSNNTDRDSDRYVPSAPGSPSSHFYMEVTNPNEPSRPETPPPKYGDIVPQSCDTN